MGRSPPLLNPLAGKKFTPCSPRLDLDTDSQTDQTLMQLHNKPPWTVVPGGGIFYCWCFFLFFFFTARSPSSLGQSTWNCATWWEGSMFNFVIHVPKFGEPSRKKIWGPKTCNVGVDFGQLQNSIANISGTGRNIQNRKTNVSTAIPPALDEKKWTTKFWMCILTQPNQLFRKTISKYGS